MKRLTPSEAISKGYEDFGGVEGGYLFKDVKGGKMYQVCTKREETLLQLLEDTKAYCGEVHISIALDAAINHIRKL